MIGIEYALWGLFGGFAIEGLEFSAAIRRTGSWPWKQEGEPSCAMLLVSVIIRLGIGAGLAVAAGLTGQISGPLGAVAIGVAAPLFIEQLAGQVTVNSSGSPVAIESTSNAPQVSETQANLGSQDAS